MYYIKSKLKWIAYLNVTNKTFRKKCRRKSSGPRAQQRVLRHQKHVPLIEKMINQISSRINTFDLAKVLVNKMKKNNQVTDKEKIKKYLQTKYPTMAAIKKNPQNSTV